MIYEMLPPAYRLGGEEYTLSTHDADGFRDSRLCAAVCTEVVRPDTVRVCCEWTNISGAALELQPMLEVRARFAAAHYVLPCILLNGNEWGAGKEPKGLVRDGVPWVFAGDRQGIPACTLSEDAEHVLALFASDCDAESLRASCSLLRNADGSMTHRLLYPYIEEPLTYIARDRYSKPLEEHVRLEPGGSFAVCAFIYAGRPMWPNFGMAGLEDAALELLDRRVNAPLSDAELWRRGIAYANTLLTDAGDARLFAIGFINRPDGFERVRHYEFGWCGQNGLYARMMLADWLAGGPEEHRDVALGVLDAWAAARGRSGLPYVHYERMHEAACAVDACNLGFYVMEMLRSHELLAGAGIEREQYLEAARGVCDFFVSRFSDEFGFGKTWDIDTGAPVDRGGTIGAYLIPGLVMMSGKTGDGRYLDCARRAYDFYFERDLSRFACTAGALDTVCIDKETSGALIMGGILLYEATGVRLWLTRATMAAYYFSAWMYHYNVQYAPDCDFTRDGYLTAGGTSVSTQHHHIDQWGALMTSWYERLARHTGDERWLERARIMWANACQLVAGEGERVHGLARPLGAQNEAYFQCRWNTENLDRAGMRNDWLVAWPGAFRLSTIYERGEIFAADAPNKRLK